MKQNIKCKTQLQKIIMRATEFDEKEMANWD